MKLRNIAIIVLVLAVIAVLLLNFGGPPKSVPLDERVGDSILDLEEARSLSAIRISSDGGNTVTLEKNEAGIWTLPEFHHLPADFTTLSRFIQNLVDARIDRFVTRSPERLERLNLGRFSITLKDSEGASPGAFQLGKAGQSGGIYFRFDDEESAYLLDQSLSPGTTPLQWADKTPLEWSPEEIRSVGFRFRDSVEPASFSASRENPDSGFSPETLQENETFDESAFSRSLRNLLSLRFTEVEEVHHPDVEEALNYAVEASMTPFEGDPVTLTYAQRPERENEDAEEEDDDSTIPAGQAYFLIEYPPGSNSPWSEPARSLAFKISNYNFNQLPQNRDDWVEVEEGEFGEDEEKETEE